MLSVADSGARRYREVALKRIRILDSELSRVGMACPRGSDPDACRIEDASGKVKWDVHEDCLVVHSVGKRVLGDVVSFAEKSLQSTGTIRWFGRSLSSDDDVVAIPARVAWSWGLRSARIVAR
jgi:hypothetical protein